jgi:hypothetical protein
MDRVSDCRFMSTRPNVPNYEAPFARHHLERNSNVAGQITSIMEHRWALNMLQKRQQFETWQTDALLISRSWVRVPARSPISHWFQAIISLTRHPYDKSILLVHPGCMPKHNATRFVEYEQSTGRRCRECGAARGSTDTTRLWKAFRLRFGL